MKILISALHKAAVALEHFSTVLGQHDNDWFTNRTGQLSFRPEVFQNGLGQFTASVACRTGCSSRDWQVQYFCTCGHWRSARQAMKAARRMARDLALYRYRFSDGALNTW
ncbi:hypothetical protein CWC46_19825 [Prodigiosinella confusarubida]|uniref:Uncharacterized protein n=1 Tax=Serratia sp. (strain ATCC 39006) TaxID=104623 RepID=A0A2I5TNM8_SERS3|nr:MULTISPECIES: hypothetical protein [Enterobacterales]AUH01850.1 hypothetical protein CWC46_19825 [Serratia sp. ATCC 39006]AUH06173.1 hypothetical protein Ser39006_019825 [Serratia sp. ATCC 39006]WJV54906.1 hypothetical protein PCO85_05625 [Prodigiosinella sp. LS101]WJV59268.1 hypothetical protein PCO84_05630 [Pectobacteriaceae bacterium C111]